MRIIFDENLGARLPKMIELCYKEVDVSTVSTLGFRGKADVELFQEFASHRPVPVFVTKDMNITKRGDERTALKESGIHFVLLRWENSGMNLPEQAWRLLRVWPSIVDRVGRMSTPMQIMVNLNTFRISPA